MAEPVRVVIDLLVDTSVPIRAELPHYLAQAVETYAAEHLTPGETLTVTSIRIPQTTQSFASAKELFRDGLYRRWLRRRQRLAGGAPYDV